MNYKILALLMAVLLCCMSFSSCGTDDGTNYIFKTVIYGNPETLDPQTATSESSAAVISSMFRGLYRIDEKGEIVPDMVEGCQVSEDGLTWTFTLRDDVYWSDGEDFSAKCTAEDFVFGFRRLINPATKSKNAEKYYCIENSEEINKGRLTDIEALGVKADGDNRLVFTLREEYPDFERLLAQLPSMPCNEEYFYSTEGRYGLYADALASNGDFCVTVWSYDKWSENSNYIILRKNKKNSEASSTAPYGINYFIEDSGYQAMLDDEIHCYAAQSSAEAEELKKRFSYEEYETSVWGIVFNGSTIGAERDVRISLGALSDIEIKSDNYTHAVNIIPDFITVNGDSYREGAGNMLSSEYSLSELKERFERSIGKIDKEKLSGIGMIMPENEEIRAAVGSILQKWQKHYGFYCSVSELQTDEYNRRIENGDFDIAVVRLSGGENSPAGYLSYFSGSSHVNPSNRKYEHILSSAEAAETAEEAIAYYKEAEQYLIDNFIFVPFCFEREYVFYSDGISGVEYNPFNGIFRFKNALKK